MRLPGWLSWPSWLLFLVVVYLPLAQLGAQAIQPGAGGSVEATDVLFTGDQLGLLGTSLLLATGAAGFAAALGVPYALLCERTRLPGRRLFAAVYLLPLLIPPYIHAIVWGRLLAANGPANAWLMERLGLEAPPLAVHSLPGAVFVLGLSYFPYVTLLTQAGLRTLDRGMEEAALMHRGPLGTMLRVTLPLVWPQIAAGALFVLVLSLIEFGVPDILRVSVFPVEIFIQFSALYDQRSAVLLSLPLLAVAALAMALLVRTLGGRSYVSLGAGFDAGRRHELGPWTPLAVLLCALPIALAVAVPVAALAVSAGPWGTYAKALQGSAGQIGTSLLVATATAGAATLLGLGVAASLHGAVGRWRTPLELLSQVPFAVPPVVLGIGLIQLWNRPTTDWLYGSVAMLVLGGTAHFVPFAVRAVHANLQQIDPRLLEAGRLAGAGTWRVALRIALPLLRNGLLAGFFIVFVLSFSELGVTLLVTPPGIETIPIKIYNLMHYGAESTVSALCLILAAIQALMAATLWGTARALGSAPERTGA